MRKFAKPQRLYPADKVYEMLQKAIQIGMALRLKQQKGEEVSVKDELDKYWDEVHKPL